MMAYVADAYASLDLNELIGVNTVPKTGLNTWNTAYTSIVWNNAIQTGNSIGDVLNL